MYRTAKKVALNEEELYGDEILVELEKVYGRKVYNREDVTGRIKFLDKEKG